MSIGAAMAGVKTCLAVEIDRYAASAYALNHPSTKVICADIRSVDFSKYRSDEETVVFGGPPCQGFSTSNQRTRSSTNQNNWLFKEFLRAVQEIEPEWVVFENVKGITETEGAKFLQLVVAGLEALGYRVNFTVLNARDYGVPQSRSRLFVVANSSSRHFEFPPPIHTKPLTVRDAIADLPALKNGAGVDVLGYELRPISNYSRLLRQGGTTSVSGNLVTKNAPEILERYRHIPQGGNWEDIPEYLMSNYKDRSRCHTGIYRRLEWDQPAVTIGNFRKNMLVHPGEDRGLSVREAARLQSFPDSFRFFGSIGFQQQQVGNAVPPLLSKVVFQQVMSDILPTVHAIEAAE